MSCNYPSQSVMMVHNFVLGLPAEPMPFNIYFVKTSVNTVEMYATSKDGTAYLVETGGEAITLTSPNNTITITNGTEIDIAQYILDNINDLISESGNYLKLTGETTQTVQGTINATNKVTATGNIESATDLYAGNQVQIIAVTPLFPQHATRKDYVDAADALKANIASPTFTGDPKAPTPPPGDNDTSIATTAFVTTALASLSTPLIREIFTYSGSQSFTLTNTPDAVLIFRNGQLLNPDQYTLVGTTLTIIDTLISTDTISVVENLNPGATVYQNQLVPTENFSQSTYYDKLSSFINKWNERTSDVTLVQIGDSISTNLGYTTPVTDYDERPPLITEKNLNYFLEEKLRWKEQKYRRFDYPSVFTEILGGGTSTVMTTDSATWGYTNPAVEFYRPVTKVIEGGTDSGVSYVFPANMRRCNLIIHSDYQWATTTTISISTGAGEVEVYDEGTDTWVEANGYVFTAKEPSTLFNGVEGTYHRDQYQKRIDMRSLTDLNAKTVTVTNVGAGRFGYWGIEYSPKEFMFKYICASKGGHNIEGLRQFEPWMVDAFNPDLVLQQCCIINEGASVTSPGGTPQEFTQRFEDYYDDLHTVKGYLVMPYILFIGSQAGIVNPSTGEWGVGTEDGQEITVPDYIGNLASMYQVKGAPFVNCFNQTLNIAERIDNLKGLDNLYLSAIVGSGISGDTLTIDNVHPNDFATQIYTRLLSPYFNF